MIRIFKKNNSKKLKIYYKFRGLILKFLDIPYFISKFEEYDKLKYILFNEKQLSLYKFISNDFIYTYDFIMKKKMLTNKKLFYNDDKKIVSTLFFLHNYFFWVLKINYEQIDHLNFRYYYYSLLFLYCFHE